MSVFLRILLIITSIITVFFVLRKIRKSQLQIEDSIFWIACSAGIIILSIFPSLAIELSKIIGIESPANFVFLTFIFVLLIKVFMMSIKISQLEHKLKILVQEIAIKEKIDKDDYLEIVKEIHK